ARGVVGQPPPHPPRAAQERQHVRSRRRARARRRPGCGCPECRHGVVVASQHVRLHDPRPSAGGSAPMSQSDTLRGPRTRVPADLLPGARVRDVALVVGAAGFVGLLAQISIHLSFTPVPITGQTLGVLLAGTALGWRRGAAAMALYAIAGVLGVPWFADHS